MHAEETRTAATETKKYLHPKALQRRKSPVEKRQSHIVFKNDAKMEVIMK